FYKQSVIHHHPLWHSACSELNINHMERSIVAVLNIKVQEVFNEPGCDKNQAKDDKERKKGCTKQLVPGAAAGGCAFDGAKIALQPITDVAHLVHGPIACEGHSWDNRHSL